MRKLIVKIIKVSSPDYWYANRIGETFKVFQVAGYDAYQLIGYFESIPVEDAEIVEILETIL